MKYTCDFLYITLYLDVKMQLTINYCIYLSVTKS